MAIPNTLLKSLVIYTQRKSANVLCQALGVGSRERIYASNRHSVALFTHLKGKNLHGLKRVNINLERKIGA